MSFIPQLKIGEKIAKIPIIQGGMSVGISLSRLSSAVANEGGIGVIGAAGIGMMEPDFGKNYSEANNRALRKEIRKAKEKTNGLIGVNILMALTDYSDLIKVSVEEGADFVFLGAGLPLKMPKELTESENTKTIPIVSSGRAVKVIFRHWERHYERIPDAVVLEGPLAGGHLGFKLKQIEDPKYSLENLLPEVIENVKVFEDKYSKKIPIVVAGGIYTGEDIYKFIRMGADGVQMATRFVATHECDASEAFKLAYVKAKKENIIIIKSPVGLPGRAIKNEFLEAVEKGMKTPFSCPWQCLSHCDYKSSPYCISLALTNAKKGKFNYGFAFAGANAYRVDKIISVKELINTLLKEYKEAVEKNQKNQ